MIAVTSDASKGVTDRFRSLPMSDSPSSSAAAWPICSIRSWVWQS